MSKLFDALFRDEPRGLLAALQTGSDPNGRDERGRTPLMVAAKHENRIAVRLLLEFGAQIDVKDATGSTPLLAASSLAMREFLLEKGARPDFGRLGGQTAAAFFVNFGRRDIVELLLRFGADPQEKTRGGRSIQEIIDDPSFKWGPFEDSPKGRQENLVRVLNFSEGLRLSPTEYVSRNWGLTFWGFGELSYDDPAVTSWTREVAEILRSPDRIETACRQYLESETLDRALVYLGRASRKAARVAAKQARWVDFAAGYWTDVI